MNPPLEAAVIFDFDGVIARGDTMASLVRLRLMTSPRRALRAIPFIPLWTVLRSVTSLRAVVSRKLVRISLQGLDAAAYAALATDHGAKLARDPEWTVARGVAAVRTAQRAGARVIVTSGTEETIVRSFLAELGLSDVPVIGSSLFFTGGRVGYREHNFGPRKAELLDMRGWNLASAELYTDSIADIDLASRVASTYLVGASRREERVFRRLIPALTVLGGWST